ncbi:putative zinc-binding metallopeptidase [Arcticibacter sp. MXS-1]|uniref:zinc-binding metallopeptidase n=1 Tax=Arcticibacter sp. MXS-1 TaxID=3341726 RepID=UPI0035A91B8A
MDPFNIEVKYKFDRFELDQNKDLVPPLEGQVIPLMEVVKRVWIEPYTAQAGDLFIKKYAPKQFVLVGSPSYNANGTITLGTAEGGRKIVLYTVNSFESTAESEVKQQLHTIHHEFAHILHQTINYPIEYKNITPGGYTSTWFNYSNTQALSLGFITSYSRAAPDEDFVEMISTMLVEGRSGFNAMVASAPASAQPLLRLKEQIVVKYFKEAWNIDFYALQTATHGAIEKVLKPQA